MILIHGAHKFLGQCKSWIDGGLQERAMTRDLDWGVKVPGEATEGKVLYVWLDAPIGYISATKQWALDNGKDWKSYWQGDDVELIHFIGKDNIVFHCIIFPIILRAHGKYALPKNVPANEFLNLEGDKLSTSRNWAIWLHEYIEDFKNQQDVLRYTLCATAPESKEHRFYLERFSNPNNSELVGILGNFVNRVMVLTNKYWKGKVPEKSKLTSYDQEVLQALKDAPSKIGICIEKYKFREALSEMMSLARIGNKYLAETEPWKLKKIDEKRTQTIMNIALQLAASLSVLSKPFLPFSAEKLAAMLNISEISWDQAEEQLLSANHQIEKPSLLFGRIDDVQIEAQLDKLG